MLPVLGKKAVLEWCMKEGLIGSSYVCPKRGKSMELRERTVVKVTNSWLACHEFQLGTADDPPRRWVMHLKSEEAQTVSHWCDREVRRVGTSSGVILAT
ncbi:hypothetical protein TNCV_3975951 [Trichonephila clavipes]|nr:hypothetical protein TNCV_3975951 [Trichonephila clavipes]